MASVAAPEVVARVAARDAAGDQGKLKTEQACRFAWFLRGCLKLSASKYRPAFSLLLELALLVSRDLVSILQE